MGIKKSLFFHSPGNQAFPDFCLSAVETQIVTEFNHMYTLWQRKFIQNQLSNLITRIAILFTSTFLKFRSHD